VKILTSPAEILETNRYMEEAAKEALKSNCRKSSRGVVIVDGRGRIVGSGHNWVQDAELKKYCDPCVREDVHDNRVTESCPAIHAEEKALLKALKSGYSLEGATLYHMKLKGWEKQPSGAPSCTSCSRSILESGITEVVLFNRRGARIGRGKPLEKNCYVVYGAEEFNRLSHEYFE
jgi:deoxycytidylate deaminase